MTFLQTIVKHICKERCQNHSTLLNKPGEVGTGSSSDVLLWALPIRKRTCSGEMGLNDSKEHGLGQGVKTGASAADVAARRASTFWTKNLEKTSAVAESGILHLESLHISLFIVRQHFLLSPAAASILASQKPRSPMPNSCFAPPCGESILLCSPCQSRSCLASSTWKSDFLFCFLKHNTCINNDLL